MIALKSQNEIAAQIAAYAADEVAHRGDRAHLLANAGALALQASPPSHLTRVLEHDELDIQQHRWLLRGSKRNAGDYAAYVAYLRRVGGSRAVAVAGRRGLLDNFDAIESELAAQPQEELPLGHGSRSNVSRVSVGGRLYAQRRARRSEHEVDTDAHMAATGIRDAIDDDRLQTERIVAGTYTDGGKTYAEIIPGRKLSEVTPEAAVQVTEQQISNLVHTVITLMLRMYRLTLTLQTTSSTMSKMALLCWI